MKRGRKPQWAIDEPYYPVDLTCRLYNVLVKAGIGTLEHLRDCTEMQLLKAGLTRKSVAEVKHELAAVGLSLRRWAKK